MALPSSGELKASTIYNELDSATAGDNKNVSILTASQSAGQGISTNVDYSGFYSLDWTGKPSVYFGANVSNGANNDYTYNYKRIIYRSNQNSPVELDFDIDISLYGAYNCIFYVYYRTSSGAAWTLINTYSSTDYETHSFSGIESSDYLEVYVSGSCNPSSGYGDLNLTLSTVTHSVGYANPVIAASYWYPFIYSYY